MSKLLNWKDVIPFGKYKNQTIEEVASFDAQYLIWANETVDYFNLDFNVLKVIQELSDSNGEEERLNIQNAFLDDEEEDRGDWGDFST